jgi:hypothetical protein
MRMPILRNCIPEDTTSTLQHAIAQIRPWTKRPVRLESRTFDGRSRGQPHLAPTLLTHSCQLFAHRSFLSYLRCEKAFPTSQVMIDDTLNSPMACGGGWQEILSRAMLIDVPVSLSGESEEAMTEEELMVSLHEYEVSSSHTTRLRQPPFPHRLEPSLPLLTPLFFLHNPPPPPPPHSHKPDPQLS